MSEASADHRAWCPKERDYIGMSDASSCSYAQLMKGPEQAEGTSEETELRLDLGLGLGLSTILSKREGEGEPKESHPSSLPLESSHAASAAGVGSCASKNWMKRAFSEAMAASVKNSDPDTRKQQSCASIWALSNANGPSWQHASLETTLKGPSLAPLDNARAPPADGASPAKDRVVGWPPVRSYRRQSLAKPAELFVKVNMDGITVGRKVDLNAYNSYVSLQQALEEMFQPAVSGNKREQDLKHFLLASDQEFVLTYEDKDGDWMLVGDVPWSLFVSSVRRLRITRTVEATGVGSDV